MRRTELLRESFLDDLDDSDAVLFFVSNEDDDEFAFLDENDRTLALVFEAENMGGATNSFSGEFNSVVSAPRGVVPCDTMESEVKDGGGRIPRDEVDVDSDVEKDGGGTASEEDP